MKEGPPSRMTPVVGEGDLVDDQGWTRWRETVLCNVIIQKLISFNNKESSLLWGWEGRPVSPLCSPKISSGRWLKACCSLLPLCFDHAVSFIPCPHGLYLTYCTSTPSLTSLCSPWWIQVGTNKGQWMVSASETKREVMGFLLNHPAPDPRASFLLLSIFLLCP